jgi:hypothetical protein
MVEATAWTHLGEIEARIADLNDIVKRERKLLDASVAGERAFEFASAVALRKAANSLATTVSFIGV